MTSAYKSILSIIILFIAPTILALDNISEHKVLFPIDNYDQKVTTWLNPAEKDYAQNLLSDSYQNKRLVELEHSYYGTLATDNSPWSGKYINFLLTESIGLKSAENSLLATFKDPNTKISSSPKIDKNELDTKVSYGINFRAYDSRYFNAIAENMATNQFTNVSYSAKQRAIATNNLLLRSLPTDDPFFYSFKITGEGYPFDNLQQTAVYAGTPLYVFGMSRDKRWDLVLTPDYIGWVHSDGIANVDDKFIHTWQSIAYANLFGLTKSGLTIMNQYKQVLFSTYIGMIFPIKAIHSNTSDILVPVKQENGMAEIITLSLNNDWGAKLPIQATKANFAMIITDLQGRPYGWGGLGFYNDCSSEMKAIFTLMGIYLPRNTQEQILAGKVIDLSNLAAKKRLDYLEEYGVPLLTLVYIHGHIFLYMGNYRDKNGNKFALSYQQMWSLKPKDMSYSSIVGKSVLFPLLLTYKEDPRLVSHAAHATFKLVYLNQWPSMPLKQTMAELLH